jgi:hypothetical protein
MANYVRLANGLWVGLTTDAKPTNANCPTGDMLNELSTDYKHFTTYINNGTTWIPELRSFRYSPFYFNDFLSTSGHADAFDPFSLYLLNSGIVGQATDVQSINHPGVLKCYNATIANGGVLVSTAQNIICLGGGETYELVFMPITLTNLTMRLGFFDTTTSADAVDGAYIEIPTTGAAVGKTANNSTRTTSSTIATLSVSTWYRALIQVNAAATAVDFTIYSDAGSSLGTQQNTTNIPTGSAREGHMGVIMTDSGTVQNELARLDWMGFWWEGRLLQRG